MNETIKTQLNHRSIRQFKPVALAQEEVTSWLMLPDMHQQVILDRLIRLSVLLMKN